MIVYISGMPGVNGKIINDTIHFLNKSKGSIRFVNSKGISESQLKRILNTDASIESFYFGQITDISRFYRTALEIEDDAILVFLSDYKLDYEQYDEKKRWFSYFDDKTIMVKTYGWEIYTSNREHLAISHQIVENIFQILSGLNLKINASNDLYHYNSSSVCLNNFTLFEEDIKIKLLSGIICGNCVSSFVNKNEDNKNYYAQLDNILERVRIELKVKVQIEPIYETVTVKEDGSIIIGEDKIVFKKKHLHFIYLFFLINSGKWFSEKNIFEYHGTLTPNLRSLIKCYNIVYGYGFTPPDSKPIPKYIQRRIDDLYSKKSTFNSYRSNISKLIPEKYGFSRLANGNKTYRFTVNITQEKIILPNSFLGFKVDY